MNSLHPNSGDSRRRGRETKRNDDASRGLGHQLTQPPTETALDEQFDKPIPNIKERKFGIQNISQDSPCKILAFNGTSASGRTTTRYFPLQLCAKRSRDPAKARNVAISRARSFLFIYGNPQLLSVDDNWRHLITFCANNNAYFGCELPKSILPVDSDEEDASSYYEASD